MLSTIVTIQRAVLFITTAASDTASRCVAGPLLFGRYPSEDPYGLCTEQTEYTTFYDGHATEAGPIISYVRYRTWLYVLIYMQIYLSCIYLVRYIPVYTYYYKYYVSTRTGSYYHIMDSIIPWYTPSVPVPRTYLVL